MKKITLKMKKITPFIYNLYRILQKFARGIAKFYVGSINF